MTDVSKVTLKVLAKFADNLRAARDRTDPDSERRLALATVAECMESALLTYGAAPASQNLDQSEPRPVEGADMAPRQKALEAAAKEYQFWCPSGVNTRALARAIAVFLASAPRFEDAP